MTPDNQPEKCSDPQAGARIVAYALGTLKDNEAERFEQHLLHCPACQRELEEAAPALETLAETREQFVSRAREANEDFESQFAQLVHDKRDAARNVSPEPSGSWLESLWAIAWGRRWVIGAVGAVAFAVLIGIRHGPELVPPLMVEEETPGAVAPSPAQKMGSAPETPMASSDQVTATKVEAERDVLSSSPTSELPSVRNALPVGKTAPSTEFHALGIAAESGAGHPPGVADQVAPSQTAQLEPATAESRHPQAATESLQMSSVSVQSGDFGDLADIALGAFRPETYLEPNSTKSADSNVAARDMARLSYQGAYGLTASEATNADTLFARRRFGEARDAYQQSLKDDSMNARLHVMVGVASLAQGDYARAKTSLQRAYELLPPGGAQRDDLGLLLARADLLAGLPDEAKNRLRQLAQGTSDSSMKVAAQTAIVKIDSMESLNVPKLIPK